MENNRPEKIVVDTVSYNVFGESVGYEAKKLAQHLENVVSIAFCTELRDELVERFGMPKIG